MATDEQLIIGKGEAGLIFHAEGFRVVIPDMPDADDVPGHVRLVSALAVRLMSDPWCQEQVQWIEAQMEGRDLADSLGHAMGEVCGRA